MNCPECGNQDQNKMAQAAHGSRVYCLCCHYSFSHGNLHSYQRAHKRAPIKDDPIRQSDWMKKEIAYLKTRLTKLESMV